MKLVCWLFGHKRGYPDIRKDWDITLSKRCVRCHTEMASGEEKWCKAEPITLEDLLERYSPENLYGIFPKNTPKIGGTLYVRRPR